MSFRKHREKCPELAKVGEPDIRGIRVREGEYRSLAAEIFLHLNLTLNLEHSAN